MSLDSNRLWAPCTEAERLLYESLLHPVLFFHRLWRLTFTSPLVISSFTHIQSLFHLFIGTIALGVLHSHRFWQFLDHGHNQIRPHRTPHRRLKLRDLEVWNLPIPARRRLLRSHRRKPKSICTFPLFSQTFTAH